MLNAFCALQSPILDIGAGWIISSCCHSHVFAGKELSIYFALWSICLAPGLPFPTMEFAPQACGQGNSAQAGKAVHITPPSWPFASPHLKARRTHWPSWLIANVILIFEITDAFNGNFSPKALFWTLWLCEAYLHEWYLKITVNGLSNCIWTVHLDEKNKKILRLKIKENQLGYT